LQYKLVIQFHPIAPTNFEDVVAVEEALIDALGDSAIVDGHDIGSTEFNIFIFTDDPEGCFQHVWRLLQGLVPKGAIHVAYRDIGKEKYIVLWPPSLERFEIL